MYRKEKKTLGITADQFRKYLVTFYEDSPDILIFDHMKEFDKELDHNLKEETDATYDPVREKLEETLKSYQDELDADNFRDNDHKKIVQGIVRDLQK